VNFALRKFWSNKSGDPSTKGVVDISIAILVVALVFTLAVRTLANANMSKVDPTVTTVTTVLVPVLGAIAIALAFLKGRK